MNSHLSELMMKNIEKRYHVNEFPALRKQYFEWRETRPLNGVRVLDATPMFFNTTAKYAVLLAAGADLTVAYSNNTPFNPDIPKYLTDIGVTCLHNSFTGTESWDVILDCTAVYSARNARAGYVELTRSGIHHYKKLNLPVFAADSGIVKEIETCLGTGESCLRALRKLKLDPFEGKKILLFGHGKVGRGIDWHFQKAGAHVTVVNLQRAINCNKTVFSEKYIAFEDSSSVEQAIHSADFIVTATGYPSALIPFSKPLLETRAYLINMGAEDEYGALIPPKRVLNGKKTLNFILDDPTQMCYIDPTMALHNAGALELLHSDPIPGMKMPPVALEEQILATVDCAGLISEQLKWMKENRS